MDAEQTAQMKEFLSGQKIQIPCCHSNCCGQKQEKRGDTSEREQMMKQFSEGWHSNSTMTGTGIQQIDCLGIFKHIFLHTQLLICQTAAWYRTLLSAYRHVTWKNAGEQFEKQLNHFWAECYNFLSCWQCYVSQAFCMSFFFCVCVVKVWE